MEELKLLIEMLKDFIFALALTILSIFLFIVLFPVFDLFTIFIIGLVISLLVWYNISPPNKESGK